MAVTGHPYQPSSARARATAKKYSDKLMKEYNCATTVIGEEAILIAKHLEKDTVRVFMIGWRGDIMKSFNTTLPALKKWLREYLPNIKITLPV